MKKSILAFILIICLNSFGQNQQVNFGNNTPKNRTEWFRPNSPTNTVGDRQVVGWIKCWDVFHMEMDTIRFTKLHSGINKGIPTGIVWPDSNGNLKHSPISEIRLDYSQIIGQPIIPTNNNQLINGMNFITGAYTGFDSRYLQISNFTWINLVGKPSFTTVATSGDYNDLINKPGNKVFTIPTFSGITTATQLSTTRDSFVNYDIDATVTINLVAGQSVRAILEYADNSGMSTNVVVVNSKITGNNGVLGLAQTNTLNLSGFIPSGKYRKVRFVLTGTGTTTPSVLNAGQEV